MLNKILENYVAVIGVLGLIGIEISPIKINPISWLGKQFNKSTNDKIDKLEKIVDNNDIDTVRNRIIANDKLLCNGEKFTEDQWNSLYKDVKKWDKYHEKYPDLNGIIKMTIEHIDECYKKQHYSE